MPSPVSATSISTPLVDRLGARTVTLPSGGVWRIAFWIRLNSTRWSCSGLRARRAQRRAQLARARRRAGLGGRLHRLDGVVRRARRAGPAPSSTRAPPPRRRVSSKRSSISAPARARGCSCGRRTRARSASSTTSSSIAVASSCSAVIGVRRSCETAANSVAARALLASRRATMASTSAASRAISSSPVDTGADVAAPSPTALSVARTASTSRSARRPMRRIAQNASAAA